MESWCFVKHKTSFFIFMMMLILMVGWAQGICLEDERKALLEIKASLHQISNFLNVDNLLPTWVDHGNGAAGSKYCDWERIKCNTTSGCVTDLSLGNLFSINDAYYIEDGYNWAYEAMGRSGRIWSLNVSLFLHFEELRKLDLSWNYIGNTFVRTGLEGLSDLKNLENLNLSFNFIETNIFPSLSELTSLKILDLTYINGYQGYSPTYDISEFRIPENLEVLNLTRCGYYGSLQMQGSMTASTLRKLKFLNLGYNQFNESIFTSLRAFPSLTTLDLVQNLLSGPLPSQEISHLTKLEKLDLSWNNLNITPSIQEISHLTKLEKLDLSGNNLNITPSIQDCKCLMRLTRLVSVSLEGVNANKSIISCLSFLPSLNILDLSGSRNLGSSFPMQELSSLRGLKELDLINCGLNSLPLKGTMSNLVHLSLSENYFEDNIMRSMAAFPSLRYLSLERCGMRGRLLANEAPNLPYLEVLILRFNDFDGILPMEALASFRHLKVLDLSRNYFVGSISSTINLLSSLQVVSFANNAFNGSLTDEGLCDLKNLHELDLSHNMFDGSLPKCFNRLSSLKAFDVSSNKFTGIIPPSLIVGLTSLEYVDFSYNEFEGSFSFSLFSNHTKLQIFRLKKGNQNFEVETEQPKGWIPMFQLKILVLSGCNINRPIGSVVPSFLLHQHKLRLLDLSHNSIEGQLPIWLLKNNTNLEALILRNNSFRGVIHLRYENANLKVLDLSGNYITGSLPQNIQNFIPYIKYLNFSSNALEGVIPTSIHVLRELWILDLSNNKFSGEVPMGLFTNLSSLNVLMLSKNALYGQVLSGNLSFDGIHVLHLDNNHFTGNISNNIKDGMFFGSLDISNNRFTGRIPSWMSNMYDDYGHSELVLRNNRLEGQFPCGKTSYVFLDISQNSFSGPIPSCLDLRYMEHLHLGSNKFTGPIPDVFRNLSSVLTLDISHNYLSGRIPEFLGELSNLRILLLGKNKFIGSIPDKLCQLTNVNLIDVSSNYLTGLIPRCLNNITGPSQLVFINRLRLSYVAYSFEYDSVLRHSIDNSDFEEYTTRDEVQFTTKNNPLTYKGDILDYMSGIDLSCNKLTGEIPEELGMLTQILALNLSHNKLSGPIPVSFSNLSNIESLDLSSNSLSGKIPSELIKLTYLQVFDVSNNNLSGKLPELKAQFGTFPKESYKGNPLLCGPPLENNCTIPPQVIESSTKEDTEKWYDIDMTSFYGSSCSTWFVFMLGFVALLYINPYWRRRWLEFVEDCMYTCYYFVHDSIRKLGMLFQN